MSRFTTHKDSPKKGWVGIFDNSEKGYVCTNKTFNGTLLPKLFKTEKGAEVYIEKLEYALEMQMVQKG